MGPVRKAIILIVACILAPACGGGKAPAKTPLTIPDVPTALSVTGQTTSRVDLSWTDASVNESGFSIWRANSLAGPFLQVGTAAANTTAYSDLGLQAGKSYFYQVKAVNAAGVSTPAGPATATTNTLTWSNPPLVGPAFGRAQHSAVFDSASNRMVLFGGIDDGLTFHNDVDALGLSGPAPGPWSPVATTGTVPPLFGHSAVFDFLRKRMIVFGGEALLPNPAPPPPDLLVYQNKVYILDLDPLSGTYLAWSTAAVAGTAPSPRALHTAVYDSTNQRMVVFGGYDGTFELQDTYTLTLPGSGPFTWAPALVAGPLKRREHAAISDPLRSRMLIFGGQDTDPTDGSILNKDSWSFSLGSPPSWAPLNVLGGPGFRRGHSGVYDASNQRFVIFGGDLTTVPTTTDEVWSLDLGTTPAWSLLAPAGGPPPARVSHSAVYDTAKNRMILYGGYDDTGIVYDDVWVIDF